MVFLMSIGGTLPNSETEDSLETGIDGIRELCGTDGLEVSHRDETTSVVVPNFNFIGLPFRFNIHWHRSNFTVQ